MIRDFFFPRRISPSLVAMGDAVGASVCVCVWIFCVCLLNVYVWGEHFEVSAIRPFHSLRVSNHFFMMRVFSVANVRDHVLHSCVRMHTHRYPHTEKLLLLWSERTVVRGK